MSMSKPSIRLTTTKAGAREKERLLSNLYVPTKPILRKTAPKPMPKKNLVRKLDIVIFFSTLFKLSTTSKSYSFLFQSRV